MGAAAGADEVASFGADISIVDMCRELPLVQLFPRFFEEDGENESNSEPFIYSKNLLFTPLLGWRQLCRLVAEMHAHAACVGANVQK